MLTSVHILSPGDAQEADPSMTQAVMSRLMGGSSTLGDAATPAQTMAPAASALPNPVLKFLHAREEPKVVGMKPAASEPHRNVDVRKMHQAGGYDISLYEKRNWAEIQFHLGHSHPA